MSLVTTIGPTPTERVREIMRAHLHEYVPNSMMTAVLDAAMEGLREAKPIIAEIILRENRPTAPKADVGGGA